MTAVDENDISTLAKIHGSLVAFFPSTCNMLLAKALVRASCQGHAHCVSLLLGCGIHASDSARYYGECPLIAASDKGHTEVVKLLLEDGCNPNR